MVVEDNNNVLLHCFCVIGTTGSLWRGTLETASEREDAWHEMISVACTPRRHNNRCCGCTRYRWKISTSHTPPCLTFVPNYWRWLRRHLFMVIGRYVAIFYVQWSSLWCSDNGQCIVHEVAAGSATAWQIETGVTRFVVTNPLEKIARKQRQICLIPSSTMTLDDIGAHNGDKWP